jgi:NAD(P)H-hydrate epimerase
MEILSGDQMRRVDRRAIESMGISSLLLMESAGRGIAQAMLADVADLASRKVLVICGKGNNGGDGLVVARHLVRYGVDTRVILLTRHDELSGDPVVNYRAAMASGVEVVEAPDATSWSEIRPLLDDAPLIVDAILGTGVRGGARGLAAQVIGDLNQARCDIVSVDLPSGLNADKSSVEGEAVSAERTYALCRPKLAHVLPPASPRAGRWKVVPIGIPDSAVEAEGSRIEWLDAEPAGRLLARRHPGSHKGTFGHLLAVAGSRGKSGAAVLLARGALRAGVGLVTVATQASNQERVAVQQAEVMSEPLPETPSGGLSRRAATRALALLETRDVLALGPGLGTETETRAAVISLLSRRTCAAVLDADGLNAFALGGKRTMTKLKAGKHPLIITPHPGEASRLLGWSTAKIQGDRLAAAKTLARQTGATVVLKGHRSLIATADGHVAVNASGNPGMATAGTGDVLTGMIGAFLARGMTAWDAARLAVYAHGDAGDRAARRRGQDSLIAGDLIEELPQTLLDLPAAGRDSGSARMTEGLGQW